jgi:hypothetical protein
VRRLDADDGCADPSPSPGDTASWSPVWSSGETVVGEVDRVVLVEHASGALGVGGVGVAWCGS